MSAIGRAGGLGLAKRGAWGVTSQALNSGSNLLLALAIARSVSPAEFGAWSLAYIGYVVALHFNRSAASTPMLLTRRQLPARRDVDVQGCVSAAFVVGAVSSLLLALAGAMVGSLQFVCWSFAAILPAVLVQDAFRYVYIRGGAPRSAAVLDVTWVIVQLLGFGCLMYFGVQGAFTLTLVWGFGALLGAVGAAARLRVLPTLVGAWLYARRNRRISSRLLIDSVLVTGSTHAVPLLVAAWAGLAAAGGLRAGQTVMGGVSMLVLGLSPVAVTEAVRALREGKSRFSILWVWSAVLASLSCVYGLLVLSLPDSAGRLLVGES